MDIADLGYRVRSGEVVTANQRLDRMTRATTAADRSASMLARQMAVLGSAMAAAFSIQSAIASARQLDAAIGELSTLLPGATDRVNKMAEAAQRMGVEFGTGRRAQIQGFYTAVSAGATNAAQATARVEAANRLAIAGVTDLQSAIGVLNTATNAYAAANLSAAEASDILFTGVRTGVTTIPELSAQIGQAVPIASALGVGFDELVASVAALTTQGQNTALAVTGIRAALTAVLQPSQQAAELAAELGINFNAAAVEAMGFAGFMEHVTERTDGSQEALTTLFGSIEAGTAVLSLAGQGGVKLAEIMGEMGAAAGATDRAYEEMASRLSTRWNVIIADAGDKAERLGTVMLQGIVPSLEFVTRNLGPVTAGVATLTIALNANRIAAVTALPAMRGLAGSIALVGVRATAATVAVGALRAATAVLLGPIGLAVTLAGSAALAMFALGQRQEEAARRAEQAAEAQERLNAAMELADRLNAGGFTGSGFPDAQSFAEGARAAAEYRAELHGLTREAREAKTAAVEAARAEIAQLEAAFEAIQPRLEGMRMFVEGGMVRGNEARQELQELEDQAVDLSRALTVARERLAEIFSTPIEEFGPEGGRNAVTSDAIRALEQRIELLRLEEGLQREIGAALQAAGLALDDQSEEAQRIRDLMREIHRLSQEPPKMFDGDTITVAATVRQEMERAAEAAERIAEAELRRAANNIHFVQRDLARDNPLESLRMHHEERLEILRHAQEREQALIEQGVLREGELLAMRNEVQRQFDEERTRIMLLSASDGFGSLAEIMRAAAGEQSAAYEIMFAISKGFAIAESIIAIQQAIAKAMAIGFPQNIPLMAAAAAHGASIIQTITSTKPGFRSGGYTGNGPVDQVAGVVHGREGVLNAPAMSGIGRDALDYMNRHHALPPSNDNGSGSAGIKISIGVINAGSDVTREEVMENIRKGMEMAVVQSTKISARDTNGKLERLARPQISAGRR